MNAQGTHGVSCSYFFLRKISNGYVDASCMFQFSFELQIIKIIYQLFYQLFNMIVNIIVKYN